MAQLNADNCYIFTDTETTGLDINFSQIIQVGSLLTDETITIEKSQDLDCKLLPWIVPNPEAFLIHKKVDCLSNQGRSHYEMMMKLRETWLNWSYKKNPVFITYNGHKFDEELFRRQFYWCLLPSYITNTDGAMRLDMLSTFQLVANFFSNKLKVPEHKDGGISLKLTDWAEANNISSSGAHDALEDCYLMTNLAELVIEKAEPVWKASLSGASKSGNLSLLQAEPFTMIGEVYFKRKFTCPVTYCGQNAKQINEVAILDLNSEPDDLFDLTDSELLELISSTDGPIRKVKINRSLPLISSKFVPSIDKFLDRPKSLIEERSMKVKENYKFQQRIGDLLSNNQTEYPPAKFVEQSVYSGFPSEADELWMERFHSSPWEERENLLEGFEDERYRRLAARLICANSPKSVSSEMISKFNLFLGRRLYTKGPWLNVETALNKISKLLESCNSEQSDILQKVKKDLKSRFPSKV